MKEIIKFLAPPMIVAVMVPLVLLYRNDSLSVERTHNYEVYLRAKQAYEDCCRHGKPHDLSFLPEDLLSADGKPVYPLKIDNSGSLTCELRTIPGTTPSVINYLFPTSSPYEISVCKIDAVSLEKEKGNDEDDEKR